MVERLYASQKRGAERVRATQNAEMAEEMRSLKFEPQINRHSEKLVRESGRKPMRERQGNLVKLRQDDLERKRAAERAQIDAQCPFTPNLSKDFARGEGGGTRSASLAAKSERGGSLAQERTVEDMLQYAKQVEMRREQRRQILDEEATKELTFTPNLNSKSLKMTQTRKFDPRSGQTITAKKTVRRTSEETTNGRPPECTFKPQISTRAANYHRQGQDTNAHNRLYNEGREQNARMHNAHVQHTKAFHQESLLKHWEREEAAGDGSASAWVNETKRGRTKAAVASEPKMGKSLNVVAYDPSLDFIIAGLREATSGHDYAAGGGGGAGEEYYEESDDETY